MEQLYTCTIHDIKYILYKEDEEYFVRKINSTLEVVEDFPNMDNFEVIKYFYKDTIYAQLSRQLDYIENEYKSK